MEPYREGARSPRRSPALVPSLALALAVVGSLALWGWLRPTRSIPKPISRYSVALPEGEALLRGESSLTVSPDGARFVYREEGEQSGLLWVRDLDQLHATPLSGTEGAR